jgi:hypothetical protein
MNFNDSLLKRVRCSIHHGQSKDYLSIDPKSFQVICTLCEKEGIKSKKKNLILVDPELSNIEESGKENNFNNSQENEESNHFCYLHPNEPSLFYCEECAKFICKSCFATEHRNHSSSTFDLISDVIKEKINKLYTDLENLNQTLEENKVSLEEKNKYFEDKKKLFKQNLDTVNQHISNALNDKSSEYKSQIESFFNGVDKEVELNLTKLEIKQKSSTKMYEEFQKMKDEINNINDDHKICLYKKEKDQLIQENRQFLFDIKDFLQEQLNQTKERVEKEESNFKEKCDNFKKNIDVYESSVLSTMKSGIPNVCSRIRRLCRYSYEKSKYFKKDSLCMIVSQNINLVGFALCGLFYEHDQPIKTYKVNLKLYEVDDANNFSNDLKEMLSIDVDIPTITNIIDPVYQFYLNNSYLISKDKFYFIILTNLSEDAFINTWSGTIYRNKKMTSTNESNIVQANNDNIKFTFMNAFGVESDLNEFSGGIISDIIYSPVE